MVYFKNNGDLLRYLRHNKGVIKFDRCEIKINMESIDNQKESLEKVGVDELAIEAQLVDAIYSSLMQQIFGEAHFKRSFGSDGLYIRESIYESLQSTNLTVKDKLETIDKLFTL